MLQFVYNLYATDQWNSNPILLSVCSCKQNAMQLAAAYSNFTLSDDDMFALNSINQTQGREDNNFQIDEIELNKL